MMLHKYIFKEVFAPFLFGVLAFTTITAGGAIIPGLVSDATTYGLSFSKVVALFFLRIPNIVTYTFPMSMLLSTLLAFGRLSGDSEITAFRSGGISIYKLIAAPLVLGFLVSLLTIFFNEVIVPNASFAEENLIIQLKDISKNKPKLKENVNIPQYKNGYLNRLIYAHEMIEGVMKDVSIAEYDQGRLLRIIFSKTATWQDGGGWIFRDGVIHQFGSKKTSIMMIKFKEEMLNIAVRPRDISGRTKDPEQLNIKDLGTFIEKQKIFGADVKKYEVNWHQKIAIPFASLIFIFLGIPLGLKPQRSSSSVGMGISIIVIFFYYVLLSLGMWLGLIGSVPPVIAAWFPNIIIGSFGIYNLVKKANL